jgi:hypothetical protein
MQKDIIIVPHPEFIGLAHQLSIAAERFNEAAREKHVSLVSIGSYLTITRKDRIEFLERVRAEHGAYDVIRELHDKIIHLLDENNHAKTAATNHR